MRSLKSWAAAAALLGAALTLSGAASAAPVTAGGLASGTASELVETVQWGPGWGYGGRGYYGHRRGYHRGFYGPRPYYGRRHYRPRVVCRVRYTPWGPREVCRRRF
jgi:hypothetical protein